MCVEQAGEPPIELAASYDLSPVLEQLRDSLRAQNVVVYRPEIYGDGWDLEYSCWVGPDTEPRAKAHRAYLRSSDPDQPTFAAYDPFAVQLAQQNRALTTADLFAIEASAETRHSEVYAAMHVDAPEQVRMLVCEGPRLLGWLGAIRDEPFAEHEVALMQSLAEPMRKHLLVQRQLSRRGLQHPVIESLLDALPEPALIFSGAGALEFHNTRARTMLEQPSGPAIFASLRRAVANRLRPRAETNAGTRAHEAFTLTPLKGFLGYTLALYTQHQAPIARAIEHASKAWALSPRQASLIEQLAGGLSNKEIAVHLGCAEVTVEKQLTQLFRRTGSRSRTELMARLHAL